MYADDVFVSSPYGAAGLGLPQIIQKNANHAAPAIAGTERNRVTPTSGDRRCRSRSTMTRPSAAAMIANRLCSHGSRASTAPVAISLRASLPCRPPSLKLRGTGPPGR